jgi:hypothetical protein
VDDELLPPHPTENTKANTTISAARAGSGLRFRIHSHVVPSTINVHMSGIGPGGWVTRSAATAVTGAVVPKATATDAPAPPLICTEELDRLQVGAGVTVGVMAQLKFTVPVNDPVGAIATPKLAVCPAFMVWEVGDPEAAPSVKPGADACTVRVTVVLCRSLPEVP